MSFKKVTRIYLRCWKVKLLHHVCPAKYTDANPVKLIYVNPQHIKFNQLPAPTDVICKYDIKKKGKRYDKLRNLGRVIDGDWDTCKREIHLASATNRMLLERFRENKNWDEIDVYRQHLARIDNGETAWHKCASREELENRAAKIEKLFTNIAKNGYRSQYEMARNKLKFLFRTKCFFDEVTVNIGRQGELLFNNSGANRLAIAQVLKLESIPARVLIRHKKWQEIRDEMKKSRRSSPLPRHLKRHAEHPDLQDIIKD